MDKYSLDFFNNKVNNITSSCTKPERDFVKTFVRQLLIKETPILNHLGEIDGKLVKSEARKFSRNLEKVALENQVDQLAFKEVQKLIQEDSSISYDLSDIAKENSKSMEGIHQIFDGSKRKISPGFCFHGVGFQDFLLKFEAHEFGEKTLNETRKKIVFGLAKKFEKKGIWLFDRGNDHKQFFKDLAKEKIKFICRIKKNRLVVNKNTGKICKIENLKTGKHEVFLLDKNNVRVEIDKVFTLIIHSHLKEKEEIYLLSNLENSKYSAEEFVEKYLERWEIEKSFKRLKTKFNLEKIRVMTLKRMVNLIAIIRLAQIVCTILFHKIVAEKKMIYLQVFKVFASLKGFLKRKSLYLNLDSFSTFLGYYLTPFVKQKLKLSPNLSLFSHYDLEKLSLF